jgi:hypothetical protein
LSRAALQTFCPSSNTKTFIRKVRQEVREHNCVMLSSLRLFYRFQTVSSWVHSIETLYHITLASNRVHCIILLSRATEYIISYYSREQPSTLHHITLASNRVHCTILLSRATEYIVSYYSREQPSTLYQITLASNRVL